MRPVINVSWGDAKAYAEWLSKETGERYRLPTEAEWEYVARSGGKEEVWAGTSDESQLGNFAVYRENSDKTAEVGSKQPNGLGLYDMSGNVWEWVEDCLYENSQGDSINGSTWLEGEIGNCRWRVARGGARDSRPMELQTAYRLKITPGLRSLTIGFRLAQDIP